LARRRAIAAAAALAAAAGLAACGGAATTDENTVSGDVLRIYSSQPLRGRLADQAQAIVRGQRLALEEARGRVGRWRISYVALNDADPRTGDWEPGLVAANARRAAQDERTIAYLGEMDTGASAVAIPTLNETGVLALSPTDTVTGFTRARGGAPGEPDKYYPTDDRSFARLVPPDAVQAQALLALMQDVRVRRVFVVDDGTQYGHGLALSLVRGARARGIAVVEAKDVDPERVDPRALAAEVAEERPDAFLYSGSFAARTPAVFRAVAVALPRARLFGPGALAADAFARHLGPAAARTLLTAPWLELGAYPRAAREVARRYRRRWGSPPPPQALYGYEAMSAVLAAIRAAGEDGNDRDEVVDALLRTRNRASILGRYSIDGNGDVSIRVYGAYRVRGGRLEFVRVLDPLGA
jgi:branched-chain amino acid transport system substrate-binding protein